MLFYFPYCYDCVLFRCLQLNFVRQSGCAEFSLASNFYGYGYTSYENLTEFAALLESVSSIFNFAYTCHRVAAYFICNYIFVPCDLFTGAPRSMCTNSCYFLRDHCSDEYFAVVNFGALRYPIVDNCENTLIHLQQGFNFPCSSSSFGNDCIDLLSMCHIYCINIIKVFWYHCLYNITVNYVFCR